jgi:hypothetical protein
MNTGAKVVLEYSGWPGAGPRPRGGAVVVSHR